MTSARQRDSSRMRGVDVLLRSIDAKGNGFVVGAVAEDGRVVPFALLRLRLGQSRRVTAPQPGRNR
jgi:hypothetical protein